MIPERQKGHIYYRCHKHGCETKTVREEALEQATIAFLQKVTFGDTDIEEAKIRIDEMVTEYRGNCDDDAAPLQLANLKDRMNRLTDALIDRIIDREDFERRRSELILEEATLQEKMAERQTFAQKANEVRKMLELVKSVATTYLFGTGSEKREIVKYATSNRIVVGKNIYLEPSEWLQQVENAIAILSCAHVPVTTRTIIEDFDIPEAANDNLKRKQLKRGPDGKFVSRG